MKYVLISLSFVCWLVISLTAVALIVAPFQYFAGEIALSELLMIIFVQGPIGIAFFYWLGPNRYKKYKLKKIEELAGRQGVEISPKPTLFQRFTKFAPGYDQEKVDKGWADTKTEFSKVKTDMKKGWKNFKAEIKELEEQQEKEKKPKEKIKWVGPIAMWKGFKAEMKKLEEQQEKEKKLKQEKYIEEQKTLLENSYINNEHKIICEAINSGKGIMNENLEGYLETNNYDDSSIEVLLDYGKTLLELKNSPNEVPNNEIWESLFVRHEVCLDMPKEYVDYILNESDDTKRIESSKGTTLICRYGKYKNKVGSYSYKYEVKYRDNKVISYKEL